MAVMPKLDEANSQAICDILGATDTGLTRPRSDDIYRSVIALVRRRGSQPAPALCRSS